MEMALVELVLGLECVLVESPLFHILICIVVLEPGIVLEDTVVVEPGIVLEDTVVVEPGIVLEDTVVVVVEVVVEVVVVVVVVELKCSHHIAMVQRKRRPRPKIKE